jgi:hypothetical protein
MLAEDVAHLLEDFGSALTLTRAVGGGAYNPATGTISAGTPTSYSVRGVFVNYLDERVDGTVVRMGDRRLLVSAQGSTIAPQIDDVVDGLKIIDVRSIAPKGVAIAWVCQARK